MQVLNYIDETRQAVLDLKRKGQSVGLVPTMGALHEGHRSLMRAARRRCDAVAMTIFVNPLQFGPKEDLAAYPRPLEKDLAVCAEEGIAVVFTPDVGTMYPPGATTTVHVGGLTDGLCGPFRPGHFDGVATVVAKLFHILPADAAFFGEKDYQQLQVVKRMVRDLIVPIEVVACPTVREADGLAMSSRNAYLSPEERRQAPTLFAALSAAAARAADGERDAARLETAARSAMQTGGPFTIEYLEVVDAETLEPLRVIDRPARICVAARLGRCRLIDNVAVDAPRRRA